MSNKFSVLPSFSSSNFHSNLKLIVLFLPLLIIAIGGFGAAASYERQTKTDRIADDWAPHIIATRSIQADLAAADAAATTEFLNTGSASPELRAEYNNSLKKAAVELEKAGKVGDLVTFETTSSGEATKLADLSSAIVDYHGAIQTGRSNNRQDLPVGAAYIANGSSILQTRAFPITDEVANSSAEKYAQDYNTLRTRNSVLLVSIFLAITACCLYLIFLQVRLARKFRRAFNLPLLGATLILGVLVFFLLAGFTKNSSSLSDARTEDYDHVRELIDIRADGLGAKSDEARYIISRGGEPQLVDQFTQREVTTQLQQLKESEKGENHLGIPKLEKLWLTYESSHDEVIKLQNQGNRQEAIDLARGQASRDFNEFDNAIQEEIDQITFSFERQMEESQDALPNATILTLGASLLAAGLTWVGLQQRISEYR